MFQMKHSKKNGKFPICDIVPDCIIKK